MMSPEDPLSLIQVPQEVIDLAKKSLGEDEMKAFLGDPNQLLRQSELAPFPDFLRVATDAYKEAMGEIRKKLSSDATICDEQMRTVAGHVAYLLELFPQAKAYIVLAEDYYLPEKGWDIELARTKRMKSQSATHHLIHDRLEFAIKAGYKQLESGRGTNYLNTTMMRNGLG